jgi:murein DD-endopeptidase MepM/ murein hydrolase activator NlpD
MPSAVLAAVLLGSLLLGAVLLGRVGQAPTDASLERALMETQPPERPWQGERPATRDGAEAGGTPKTESVFEGRLPEQAEPESGALGYLRLLEHLPAQPPALGAVSSPFGTRVAPHARVAPHRGDGDAAQGSQWGQSGVSNGEEFLNGRRLGAEEFHSGIDIAVPTGTPVRAPGPGVVIATGRSPRLGTYVRLLHEEVQLETVLAHLSRVAGGLKRGQPVRRGEVVGFSGNSGRSTGPHLHFEIRSLPGRVPVDPTEVYELYFTCLDHLSRFPIGSVHARLESYRIWAPVGGGGGKGE